ncbi:MAG: DUF2339 domain-containing protein [Gammaproteobacteria bacterium]
MVTLAFLGAVAAIVVMVLAVEVEDRGTLRIQRPTGLITWLTSGNWPAKVGGALVIVGVGALLRFALLEIDVPPMAKLVSGIVIAAALGLASLFVGTGPSRRAVSLALGGAAFGVAYLTAYSAFGLFNYLSNPAGLALLGLTSAGAGIFATTRSALSLAVLSMIGAFLAPAFALDDPGPAIVYGYYTGASVLTLAMVAVRGWRPLIHLSFLFTLAGGIFFAWTASYYTPQHADVMLPMLLLLTAVHVAMPIVEHSPPGGRWVERLDLAYMIVLPAVVALLSVWIAPTRIDLATELMCLGALWAIAAVAVQVTGRRGGAAVHLIIALLMFGLGVAARFRDLPWELISLAFAVGALAIAARKPLDRIHSVLAGLVVLFGVIQILLSLGARHDAAAWVGTLVERLVAAALIIFAGAICRRIKQSLDTLLLAVGICWAVVAIGLELVKHELATVALVAHGVALLVALSLWIPGRKVRIADRALVPFAFVVVATAVWAAISASVNVGRVCLLVAPLALITVAVRPEDPDYDRRDGDDRAIAAFMAGIAAGVWAFSLAWRLNYSVGYFAVACAVSTVIVALLIGRAMPGIRGAWVAQTSHALGIVLIGVLLFSCVFYIGRETAAIVLEVLCLAGLALTIYIRRANGRPVDLSIALAIVALGLVLQANLLRRVGPPAGNLSIGDLLQVKWPAVVSLLWAIAGSALTIWSRKVLSRTLWISGAVLLVVSAVKLVLFDFGSLGQLANILAVIAAGGVFLLVGWLAPMPPAAPKQARAPPPPSSSPKPAQSRSAAPHAAHELYAEASAQSSPSPASKVHHLEITDEDAAIDASNRRSAWTIAIVVVIFLVIAFHNKSAGHLLRAFGLGF